MLTQCFLTQYLPWLGDVLTYLGWYAPETSEAVRSLVETLYPYDPSELFCR